MELRATVTVDRSDPHDAGHRQILVRIDGGPTISLMAGESHTFDLAPGSHTLNANNTLFWKNVPFDVAAGQHVHFSVVNVASRMSFGFLAGLGLAPMYLRVTQVAGERDSDRPGAHGHGPTHAPR